jgi:membrane protein implicated in regulation of membrane protease activity
MKPETRSALVAAAIFLAIFGIAAFFLPTIMLAAGEASLWLAAFIAIAFIGAFFLVFWLRGRYQERRKD